MSFLKTTLLVIGKLAISIIGSILILIGSFFLGQDTTNYLKLSTFMLGVIPMLSAFLFPWFFPVLARKYDKLKAGLIWICIFGLLLLIDYIGLCIEWPHDGILRHLKLVGADMLVIMIFTFTASLLVRKQKSLAPQQPA